MHILPPSANVSSDDPPTPLRRSPPVAPSAVPIKAFHYMRCCSGVKLRENTVLLSKTVSARENKPASKKTCGEQIFFHELDRPITDQLIAARRLVYKHRVVARDLTYLSSRILQYITCQINVSHVTVSVKNALSNVNSLFYVNLQFRTTYRLIDVMCRVVVIDALCGQWHDGRRCCPGCSWLFPWSCPWGSC